MGSILKKDSLNCTKNGDLEIYLWKILVRITRAEKTQPVVAHDLTVARSLRNDFSIVGSSGAATLVRQSVLAQTDLGHGPGETGERTGKSSGTVFSGRPLVRGRPLH